MTTKILYVEDDHSLAFLTSDQLRNHGFVVTHCADGKSAIKNIRQNEYDIVILDIMLPDIDGYEIASTIRKKNKSVPIIFLSAKTTLDSKLKGLTIGADDYITKPYSIDELVLKIKVFLKRSNIGSPKQSKNEFIIGEYSFCPSTRILSYNDDKNKLTHREAKVLEYLCLNINQICKREEIQEYVWENDSFFSSRRLDVFISRLRKLLIEDENIKIESVHGIGYRLFIGEN